MANDNEKRSTYTSSTGSIIMIVILILSAISVAHKTPQVISHLETFKKTYNSTENVDIYFKNEIDAEQINLYKALLNDTLITENVDILDKQRTYQVVILIFSCICVGVGLIGLVIRFVAKISTTIGGILVMATALAISCSPLIVLIMSALSLKKVKKIQKFDLDAWKGMDGYLEIENFNGYIDGFRKRNIAIIVLSSVSIAVGALTLCCAVLSIVASS